MFMNTASPPSPNLPLPLIAKFYFLLSAVCCLKHTESLSAGDKFLICSTYLVIKVDPHSDCNIPFYLSGIC